MKQREREKRNVLVVFFQKYPNICIYVFYNVINIYNYGYFTDVEIVLMKKLTENEIYSIIIIAMKKKKCRKISGKKIYIFCWQKKLSWYDDGIREIKNFLPEYMHIESGNAIVRAYEICLWERIEDRPVALVKFKEELR